MPIVDIGICAVVLSQNHGAWPYLGPKCPARFNQRQGKDRISHRGAIGKVTQYAGMPIIERARLTMTGSTYTLYGHFNDTFILSPTNAGATRTVTLSNKMGPTGSIGENMTTPHGRMAHVYRRTGTADAFDLIVKNHDGTTLSTITTSDTKKSFYFNDTDWVLG